MQKINILGSEWKITFGKVAEFATLKNADGYCDSSTRQIVVDDMESTENEVGRKSDIENYKKQVLRHEIIHAFLYESGLLSCGSQFHASWAENEEMIDWIAIQSPKIFEIFRKLDIL